MSKTIALIVAAGPIANFILAIAIFAALSGTVGRYITAPRVAALVEGGAAEKAGFQPGDLVDGEGHIVCGRCRNCLAGRRHLCMKEGFDVGLEMSGNSRALADMIDNMCHGGRIALLGIMPGKAAID